MSRAQCYIAKSGGPLDWFSGACFRYEFLVARAQLNFHATCEVYIEIEVVCFMLFVRSSKGNMEPWCFL